MHKSITISNIIFQKVGNIKLLGVIIDSKLTWSTHISFIKRKVSRGIAILCKARRLLKASTLVTPEIDETVLSISGNTLL